VIPGGEIHSQAVRECLAARDRYIKHKGDTETTSNEKAGLTFHTENTSSILKKLAVQTEFLFVVGLTAVFEYICAEIMELCPAVNVECEAIITIDVVISSIQKDKELLNCLDIYLKEEILKIEKETVDQQGFAAKLLTDVKKHQSWSNTAVATENEILKLEKATQIKVPAQLKLLLLSQNGNDTFGIDNIETIISRYQTSQAGDLFSILEFIPLKSRGNNQYDCLDALSGHVIRFPLPLIEDASAFPVVAKDLAFYIKKSIAAGKNSPSVEVSCLPDVNMVAAEVCNLFKNAREQEF